MTTPSIHPFLYVQPNTPLVYASDSLRSRTHAPPATDWGLSMAVKTMTLKNHLHPLSTPTSYSSVVITHGSRVWHYWEEQACAAPWEEQTMDDMIWIYGRQGKAKTTPHYSSACLPAADEASIPPPPLPLQIPHACVAGTPSSAGLRACTVSTTRSRFVPSLAWTLALVSVLLPGNRGSTSGGCISYVCKNGPLGSGFQIHADMYLLSHTSVMLSFFFMCTACCWSTGLIQIQDVSGSVRTGVHVMF